MYESYFGLRERAFDLSPSPRFLVLTEPHQEALRNLQYGIATRKGLTLLIGEAGSGKTTIIRAAIAMQSSEVHTVHLSNPTLSLQEFTQTIAERFQLTPHATRSKAAMLVELEALLRERFHRGETTVLILDEAQSMPAELLEEVRLLANIETDDTKLLSIVLAGQPELADRMNQHDLRQLKQRAALRCDIRPLSPGETALYIAARLETAGATSSAVFTEEAVALMHNASRGLPRTINVLADNALLAAFGGGRSMVDSEIVRDVCRDFDLDPGTVASAYFDSRPQVTEPRPPTRLLDAEPDDFLLNDERGGPAVLPPPPPEPRRIHLTVATVATLLVVALTTAIFGFSIARLRQENVATADESPMTLSASASPDSFVQAAAPAVRLEAPRAEPRSVEDRNTRSEPDRRRETDGKAPSPPRAPNTAVATAPRSTPPAARLPQSAPPPRPEVPDVEPERVTLQPLSPVVAAAPSAVTAPVATAPPRAPAIEPVTSTPPPTPTSIATPVVTSAPASTVSVDEAVQPVLDQYRRAFGRLSAADVQRFWPSVNTRNLQRAFDQISSQEIAFDACAVSTATTERASVSCRGTARFVPKVGGRSERVEARNWTFRLSRRNADWVIDQVESR